MCSPAAWSAADADRALQQLLNAVLQRDSLTTARDAEIAAVQAKHNLAIASQCATILDMEVRIEQYYRAHREKLETDGKKSIQFAHGCMGMRTPSNPALVPLNENWTWEKVAKKLKTLFRARYFHKPKPPGIDKVKVKSEMTAEQLAKVGLKLDTSESFFIDLNRLAPADRKAA